MADYELFAPDDATMQLALQKLQLTSKSGKSGGTIYAVDNYGTKYVQSGTRIDGFGKTIPNMVAQTGRYANVRWQGASVLSLSGIPAGATIVPLVPPYYRVFFGIG
jgi:hypothetical protein